MSPWDAHAADILRAYCALLLAGPRSVVRGADGTRKHQMCAGGGGISRRVARRKVAHAALEVALTARRKGLVRAAC